MSGCSCDDLKQMMELMGERRRQNRRFEWSFFFFFLKKTGRNGKENLSCLSLMEFFRCSFTKTETV